MKILIIIVSRKNHPYKEILKNIINKYLNLEDNYEISLEFQF